MYDEEKWHPTVKEPIKIVNSGVEKCLDNGTELFYLTFDGKLFAVGYNGNGIMGLGWQPWDDTWKEKYSSLTYTYPIFEIGTNVIDIAADDFNAGYVTADGKVYISGFGADGSYNKSLYFVERTDIKLAGNCNGTLINQVGPYDISISIGSDKLCCLDKIINLDVPRHS